MSHDQDPAGANAPDDAGEPTFASPTPPGSLPAGGLDDVHLPGTDHGADGEPDRSPGAPADPADPADPATTPGGAAGNPVVRRRALLASGAVVALALVAGGIALGVEAARTRAWAPVTADVAAAREVNAVQLVLGSCVADLPTDGPVERVTVVPCDDPHQAQVVGRTDAAPGAVWPGADQAGRKASQTCGPALLGPQGRTEADGLRFVVWAPSEASWDAGDRTSLCLAAAGADRAGSLLH